MRAANRPNHPLSWVPTGYITMALTYNMLTAAAVVMFSNLGMDNARAAEYASALGIAYTVKPLFAAFLEMYKSKKFFVLATQVILGIGYFAVAAIMQLPNYISLMMALFWALSFIGSTQDITTDGVYVTSLNATNQAKYCGWQSLSWNFGKLAMLSIMIALSGYLHEHVFKHDPHASGAMWVESWQIIFVILGVVMLVMALWHWRTMPEGSRAEHAPTNARQALGTLSEAFVSFFRKKGIWMMIAFALLFRVSYGFLLAPSMLFMKDSAANGGLLLSNQEFGLIYGTYGLAANIIGSLIGGAYVAKHGLQRVLFPLCCAINIPNISFLLLAIYQPESHAVISAGVVVEQFFFGIGSVGFMIYLMQQLAPGKFTTAHYAFGTGLMALCMILTGMVSGYIQQAMGYIGYFAFVMAATIPSFVVCWYAPFHVKQQAGEPPMELKKAA
jgi:MFS transporter, PAT family, beta-lactamase induction signal transducer AmpG